MQTATRKKEIREKILETLDSLSDTINHTVSEIKLYSGDSELKDHSEQLYMGILDFVRHCTTYLSKSSAGKSVECCLFGTWSNNMQRNRSRHSFSKAGMGTI